MRIWNELVAKALSQCRIEYAGTHNSDPKAPFWGRRAYWRLYTADGNYIAKVTAPVKSINPRQATLDRLLHAEVKRRIEAIQETCETDHYGQVCVYMTDPYSIRRILEGIDKKYAQQIGVAS